MTVLIVCTYACDHLLRYGDTYFKRCAESRLPTNFNPSVIKLRVVFSASYALGYFIV